MLCPECKIGELVDYCGYGSVACDECGEVFDEYDVDEEFDDEDEDDEG